MGCQAGHLVPCRKAETEADSIGMRLAAKACYDPSAAGQMFFLQEVLHQQTVHDSIAYQCVGCQDHTSVVTCIRCDSHRCGICTYGQEPFFCLEAFNCWSCYEVLPMALTCQFAAGTALLWPPHMPLHLSSLWGV